jgi:propanediol utilization protein
MRTAPKTDIRIACLRSTVEKDPSITLRNEKLTVMATMGLYIAQQLVRVALKALGHSYVKRVLVHAQSSSTEIATLVFLDVAIRIKQRSVGLFLQSMRLALDEPYRADISIGRERAHCMDD